jgi:hypothetical protein
MDSSGLIDSSRELISIYAIYFIINLYLTLLFGVQISEVMELKISPGSPLICLNVPNGRGMVGPESNRELFVKRKRKIRDLFACVSFPCSDIIPASASLGRARLLPCQRSWHLAMMAGKRSFGLPSSRHASPGCRARCAACENRR